MSFQYPFNQLVSYETDDEYRAQICKVFAMANRPDEFTYDPRDYSDDDANVFINRVLYSTESIPAMRTLYIRAASAFMTEDVETGFVSLLSYDYFAYFHACLCAVLRGADPETVEEYTVLLSKFDLRV
jgi:hypothetical protein